MTIQNDFLTAKDIKGYLKIGNDKLYGFILNDKRINKYWFANKYYIDTQSFIYFLKGKRDIDFSKACSGTVTKDNLPNYVSTKEFSKLFGISTNTTYKYLKNNNTFPATKIGEKYYIWIDLVPFWFAKRKTRKP